MLGCCWPSSFHCSSPQASHEVCSLRCTKQVAAPPGLLQAKVELPQGPPSSGRSPRLALWEEQNLASVSALPAGGWGGSCSFIVFRTAGARPALPLTEGAFPLSDLEADCRVCCRVHPASGGGGAALSVKSPSVWLQQVQNAVA